jgi:NAD(P)-dependent dehydrogenase (short-subunit alcohol dehydrogenase family)
MVKQGIKGGRIVFVSSFLGYTTFVGYAGYSAGKYAIRGKSPAPLLHKIVEYRLTEPKCASLS